MKLAIVGYRKYTNWADFCTKLNGLFKRIGDPEMIITGDAKGADEMARSYAENANIELKVFYADWNKYGRVAGPKRNVFVVQECDKAVVFVSKFSKGSYDVINKMNIIGKECIIYNID